MNNKIIKKITFINTVLIMTLIMSGCMGNKEEIKPKKRVVKLTPRKVKVESKIEEQKEQKEVVLFKDLTPLEKCKVKNGKLKNKYNLIITAPKNSKIKILNIEFSKNIILIF